jgi:diguanylate cyclase (GGDEF)-like protein
MATRSRRCPGDPLDDDVRARGDGARSNSLDRNRDRLGRALELRPALGRALPPRLRRHVLATIAVGVPVAAAAVAACVRSDPGPRTLAGVATFFGLAVLAEWRPLPIDVEGGRLVSLAFVFIVAGQLLFGWQWSVLIGALAIGLVMALERDAPVKAAFNAATYAIAAGLAALPLLLDGAESRSNAGVAAIVVAAGGIFVLANVALVCGAIAFASDGRFRDAFVDHVRYSGPVFAIAVLVAAQAVILWRLSAPLVVLLGAPLFALTLYQRSSVRRRVAEREAATDSLTGLKNRRAFEEDAARRLAAGEPTALCLIDVDRFKEVNDRHGHPAGDAVLAWLAAALEETAPGLAYRLGGDELALLLDPRGHDRALDAVRRRFAAAQPELPEQVTVSAGVAFFPHHADDLHALLKRADAALYRSKVDGRARVSVYGTDALDGRADTPTPPSRRLAELVGAVAATTARERVASLALALASRLGVEGDELEHVRLAALVRDSGPAGRELLRELRLPEATSLGARIVDVAAAFEALASGRGGSVDAALRELRGESGRFDPPVVAALAAHLARDDAAAA